MDSFSGFLFVRPSFIPARKLMNGRAGKREEETG
jgi:hypothetical protein